MTSPEVITAQTADQPSAPQFDLTGLHEAIAFYKAGDLVHGDEAAKTAKDDLVRLALEWTAVRTLPHEAGFTRLQNFAAAHPDWPALSWLRNRVEETLYADHRDKAVVEAFFCLGASANALWQTRIGAGPGCGRASARSPKTSSRSMARSRLKPDGGIEKSALSSAPISKSPIINSAPIACFIRKTLDPPCAPPLLQVQIPLALAKARIAVINEEASDKLLQNVPHR